MKLRRSGMIVRTACTFLGLCTLAFSQQRPLDNITSRQYEVKIRPILKPAIGFNGKDALQVLARLMGLDSYWVDPETRDVMELAFQPTLKLVGGVLSEHGNGSFRSKVYNTFIEAVTRQSLYQDLIPNAVVREMATALEGVPEADIQPEPESEHSDGLKPERQTHPSVDELRDLKRMFRAYADAGAALAGWW
jgi:hypothetical protein